MNGNEEFISKDTWEKRNGQKGHCIWLTGFSGSGKTTIARELQYSLFNENRLVFVLDGDNLRQGLCRDLGFSSDDRNENIRRVGEVAKLMVDVGWIVICSFISPFSEMRNQVRSLFSDDEFSETYVKCSIEMCKSRDPKGLYAKALSGKMTDFTGIDSPYEIPESPEITVDTERFSCVESVSIILNSVLPKIRLK